MSTLKLDMLRRCQPPRLEISKVYNLVCYDATGFYVTRMHDELTLKVVCLR